ncbi:release factor glutamine methyltransferase [Microcella putealis]|uniref:Release factor glutamine methyltransferase n=1 Tax=Microcella putealis TaxID=337005 RepID=A0A4Q7LVX9_9MICO|nr:release factor glutamine methyltransferase [Microcella putealis]TQM24202.1 release factor glutamine methyltransferase [Microcella putealis]
MDAALTPRNPARVPATIDALLAWGADELDAAGIATARVDAAVLIGHVLDMSRGEVEAKAVTRAPVDPALMVTIVDAVTRRAAREPLQHITGVAYFRGITLHVGPGVFVPRPETETVAQFAIDALLARPTAEPLAVDLGSGSGALALALATEVPHARVVAVERTPAAVPWTRRNVGRLGDGRVELVVGDLADALPQLNGQVDVVVSNPPYIPERAVPRDPEVRLHDPVEALYSGADGLDAMRAVAATAMRLLSPGGTLVVEHGEEQADAVAGILRMAGLRAVATHRDLVGRDRATVATR